MYAIGDVKVSGWRFRIESQGVGVSTCLCVRRPKDLIRSSGVESGLKSSSVSGTVRSDHDFRVHGRR